MIEALKPAEDQLVVEVGSGYRSNPVLLAPLCKFIWSIEWFTDLADTARANVNAPARFLLPRTDDRRR